MPTIPVVRREPCAAVPFIASRHAAKPLGGRRFPCLRLDWISCDHRRSSRSRPRSTSTSATGAPRPGGNSGRGCTRSGVDLVVTPYRGRPVESPWWRVAPNPDLSRGRVLPGGPRTGSRGSRAIATSDEGGASPEETGVRPADARDDPTIRHAPLEAAPRATRRARAARRGPRLHDPDGTPPRHPHGAP